MGIAATVIGGISLFVTLPVSLTATAFVVGAVASIWGAGRVFGWW